MRWLCLAHFVCKLCPNKCRGICPAGCYVVWCRDGWLETTKKITNLVILNERNGMESLKQFGTKILYGA